MQQKKHIHDLIWEGTQYISERSYSSVSLYHYCWVWTKFRSYAEENGNTFYSTEIGKKFFKEFTGNTDETDIDKKDVSKLRAMKVLDDIFYSRPVATKYMVALVYIPECFRAEYDAYKGILLAKGQKKRTLETKLSRLSIFLRFLEKQDSILAELDFQTYMQFQEYLSSCYSVNAQGNIKFTLRDFLKTGEMHGFISKGASALIGSIHVNKHDRLPSTYTRDEINRILSAVDRDTAVGIRDYAMLVLLTHLGIRTSDICSLTLNSICPESHTLVFRQQKTGNYERLPLTELAELALADYLKNARPQIDSRVLFIVCEGANKGRPYGSSMLYWVLNKYMQKAGINTEGKRHGTHSMRHSLSSHLLKEGTALPVITGILGHSSTETTTRYLWMDTEQLRKLALEVPYEI